METVFTIFLFIAIMAITAMLFGGWLIVSILKFVFRAVAGLAGSDHAIARRPRIMQMRCPRDRCGAINPMNARFCRRCGHEMLLADSYQVRRRAALW